MDHFKITETEIWEYISKTADDITIQKVEKWMGSTDYDEDLFNKITTIYKHTSREHPSVEQAKKRFFTTVKSKPKTTVWKEVLKYAAILIVIISGTYFYNSVSSNKNQIVVQTTYGEQKSIELSDGSKVWINASSSLTYNSETPRTLYLEGEAFFEVAKDSLNPFTVTTPNHITVKALGTSFNVKSYQDSPTTETKLLTGKVEVTSNIQFKERIILVPDEKVTFYKHTQEVVKSKMNHNESIIAWREGKIQFENISFREIAVDLEAQFGQQILFKNEDIATTKFTGSFDNTTPIDEIFEVLKISKDFTYQLNTKTNEWMIK
ncbi:FecR domain-containing protein [Aquimarina sp. MMG016]|uniref:FecR family protein n=1 Tax=Aquimarina sp. MMG016 TaxID=2822690 RepID=UPI001B39F901|nr:FecR domain-containing protein [Aquimarina sp. MMG016]MBQ4820746.1 FecR domain-containing protein [Aquimarina sp. MMG016]